MSSHANPNIVTDGLVLCLDAADIKSYPGSGNTWTDRSGNSINGTLTNGPTFSTDNGGCIVFDGIDDQVSFTPSFGPGVPSPSSDPVSISAWVNCSNVATPNNIVSKNGPYFMRIVNSRVRFNVYTSTGWLFQNGTTVLSNNVWYNFAMVYDGSTFKGYINGVEEFSVNKTGTVTSNAGLILGYTTAVGENAPFVGKIAYVSIYYGNALTAEEVLQNFNATKDRFIR
tara:strand:- start:29 stop:709 length:681 start_codon:yes stop_codon:yes gene_type:complete